MASRPMKDSGVEWIGEIPNDWQYKKLKYVADIQTGNTPSMKNENYYSPNGTEWIKTNNLLATSGVSQSEIKISTDGLKYARIAKAKSILVSCIGDIGKMGFIEVDSAYNQQINAVTFDEDEVFWKYGMYYISIQKEQHQYFANGNVLKILNAENQKKITVPIPSIAEQQKIASFLDEKVAHIDSILEDTKKSIEDLKAYKQSLITETVTKGLNANVEMKDTGIEWIGQIPKHWVLSKIKYRVSLRNEKDPYKIGDKYIGLEHIESNNGRIHSYDEDYNGGLTDKFKSGDVLFSKLRPYLAKGFIASFDGYCSGELLTFKKVEGDKRYFLYYILSGNFIDAINASTYGTKMPRANWDYIKELPIPGLPIYEQQIIADILDEKTSHINRLIRNKEKMVEELESYKKSLIYEYVTGKKEVQ